MKNTFLVVMFLFASYSFSQSINDYKAVIIPVKYDFQKSENEYRLQTKTKVNLEKAGMTGFYANQSIPAAFNERCSLLYIDIVEDKAFLATKLFILFKDCSGKIVYQSPVGKSKEKDFDVAYSEAMNLAFENICELKYEYNGGGTNTSSIATSYSPTNTVAVPSVIKEIAQGRNTQVANATKSITNDDVDKNQVFLYAQPTSYGYQLVDAEPKVIMKIYKTSNPASFIAKKEAIQGMLISKENQWFFEYYQNDQLISEKINVKF